MYICLYICIYICFYTHTGSGRGIVSARGGLNRQLHNSLVCIYVCIYVYIYVYIHTQAVAEVLLARAEALIDSFIPQGIANTLWYSVYWLHWYKSTNTDAGGAAGPSPRSAFL